MTKVYTRKYGKTTSAMIKDGMIAAYVSNMIGMGFEVWF